MHFGRKILQEQYGPWADKYLDYQHLKDLLHEVHQDSTTSLEAGQCRRNFQSAPAGLDGLPVAVDFGNANQQYGEAVDQQQKQQRQQQPQQPKGPEHRRKLSVASLGSLGNGGGHGGGSDGDSLSGSVGVAPVGFHSIDFIYALDKQVEKILFFYLQEQGQLAQRLAACKRDFHAWVLELITAGAADMMLNPTALLATPYLGGFFKTRRMPRKTSWSSSSSLAAPSPTFKAKTTTSTLTNTTTKTAPMNTMEIDIRSNNNSATNSPPPQYAWLKQQCHDLQQVYYDLAVHLLHLIQYVELNVTGIRKILKKHDKITGMKLSPIYLSGASAGGGAASAGHEDLLLTPRQQQRRFRQFPQGHGPLLLQPLLHQQDDKDSLAALILVLETSWEEFRHVVLRHQQHSQQLPFSLSFMPPHPHNPSPAANRKLVSGPSHSRNRTVPDLSRQLSFPQEGTATAEATGQDDKPVLPPLSSQSPPPSPPPPVVQYNHLEHSWYHAERKQQLHDQVKHRRHASQGYGAVPTAGGACPDTTSVVLLRTDPSPILAKIHAARNRLKQTSEFIQFLAAPMMTMNRSVISDGDEESKKSKSDEGEDGEKELFLEEDEEETEEEAAERVQRKRQEQYSSFLNLMSTFLYMTNYYIVAPSSGKYAEKLGSNASLSGIIIGMTPVAALLSTFLYSWWTSHSYKAALIFASTCSVLGNIFYAAGLPLNSLAAVMIGRLLNGFGSARAINRRYICDTFSHQERTAASAAFVTAGALGMAAGPAVASCLRWTTVQQSNNLYWQDENSPGWFMGIVWMVYLICLVIWFQDPPKKKLAMQQQQQKEQDKKDNIAELMQQRQRLYEEHQALLQEQNRLSRGMENGATSLRPFFLAESSSDLSDDAPLWRNIPVMAIFWVYFVLKLVLETALCSTATLTDFYFGWNAGLCGFFMAALGLLMLPANLVVAHLSHSMYEDRELIFALQVVMLIGCLAIMKYRSGHFHTGQEDYAMGYSLVQYITGTVIIFLSTNALEGPTMSLLSKTIPKSWSAGIFNVGLLATEAGTLGRVVGDLLVTVYGSGIGIEYLLNSAFGTTAGLSFVTIVISYFCYDYLEPVDKYD